MAKEKYVVQTELDVNGSIKNAKKLQSEINNIGRLAKETNKNAKITGSVTMQEKGLKTTQQALKLAKKNVDELTKALAQAKMNNATPKQIQNLENQLTKAKISATRLSTEMAQIGTKGQGGTTSFLNRLTSGISGALGSLSKMGNIVTGISSAWGMVSGAVGTATNLAKSYGNSLMNTYDKQVQAQKTLSTTLSDGAKGYEVFNSHIDKGNLLLKSQRNDLNELGATISSYMKTSGDEAYKTVNAINAVGDSLGLSMDVQKQFTYGLAQALGSGTLHAQDFNQMMQSALGAQFRDTLIQAANELQNVGIKAGELPKALQEGKVSADILANTFGDNWASKMAKAQTAMKGIEVSAGGVKRELKAGKLSVDDFKKVFGDDFATKLTNAMNATSGGTVTMENFKQAMEDGTFNTEVMNRALQIFQAQGETLASNGPSTWGQIREMISNGFNTSSLEGFRKGMSDVDVDMANMGNSATEMSMIVGQQLGQMAGQAVGSLVKIIDKNKDGKVSEEEFQGAVEDAKKEVQNFFNKVNGSSIMGFVREIGGAIRELSRLYSWLNTVSNKIDDVVSGLYRVTGKSGLIGKVLGFNGKNGWSSGWTGWAVNPVEPLNLKTNERLQQKILGSRAGKIPLDLQFFAGQSKAIERATQQIPSGLGNVTTSPTIGTQDNSNTTIEIKVNSSADGRAIANEIYSKLERNGVKLNRR